MAKSFVLRALRIFSLDEMLKLSQAKRTKSALFKKAAGEELVVWDDAPEPSKETEQASPDNILPFTKKSIPAKEVEPIQDPSHKEASTEEESGSPHLLPTEFILWQRELTKDSGGPRTKDAFKGYHKATEMYVVKTSDAEGKEKIRFASTNGVLINKKQA